MLAASYIQTKKRFKSADFKTKNAWARSLGIVDTRIQADFWPHGGVASLRAIPGGGGTFPTANVLIDENGKVVFVKVYDLGQLPPIDEVIEAIKKLGSSNKRSQIESKADSG